MLSRRKFLGMVLAAAAGPALMVRNARAEDGTGTEHAFGGAVAADGIVHSVASLTNAAAVIEGLHAPESSADAALYQAPQTGLGRVASAEVAVHAEPNDGAEVLRRLRMDDLLTIRAHVAGDALKAHNDQWLQLDDGYVYSSQVQPVRDVKNEPQPEAAQAGFWCDVTVPYIDARVDAAVSAKAARRLYYGSVYRVIGAAQDGQGEWWYRLQYGVSRIPGPWAPAIAFRRFDPLFDLSPISPNVADKRIEVRLDEQLMTAYENGRAVMRVRVSTGVGRMFTPKGSYRVFRKAPGQRLVGGWGADYYDLPGVPFVTYFTYNGIAIHGAYWHNEYGVPRSHGCVNVPVEVARWFWRWTTPVAPVDAPDIWFRPNQGTRVDVI